MQEQLESESRIIWTANASSGVEERESGRGTGQADSRAPRGKEQNAFPQTSVIAFAPGAPCSSLVVVVVVTLHLLLLVTASASHTMGVKQKTKWGSYQGTASKLVIGLDMGTTYSGAAYAFLRAGEEPKVVNVCKFPRQRPGEGSKVPSVLLYSHDGHCLAVGSEVAEMEAVSAGPTGSKLHKAEWWKLALCRDDHPSRIKVQGATKDSPFRYDKVQQIRLPPGKSAKDCYVDFIKWMMRCVESYIRDNIASGEALLKETSASRVIVCAHPNGWEGSQQEALRRCFVDAAVVASDRAKAQIRMVTEAECSLTYALMSQSMASWTECGSQIVIADCGGGTVDISAYAVQAVEPILSVREAAISQCLVAGATLVDERVAQHVRARLQGTKYGDPEDVAKITQDIIKTMKESFTNERTPVYVRVGGPMDVDEPLSVIKGQLVIPGQTISGFYQPSIEATAAAIRESIASLPASRHARVALVGGFAESTFFRDQLRARLGGQVSVAKPDSSATKAVAHGAVAWAIEGAVKSRRSKMAYGVRVSVPFDKTNAEHAERSGRIFIGADSRPRLPHAFQTLLSKEAEQGSEEDVEYTFGLTKGIDEPLTGAFDLLCYRADGTPPAFIDDDDDRFDTLCRLDVDLERISKALDVQTTGNGLKYRSVKFVVKLSLGTTELQAQWVHSGICEVTGDAAVVFLEDLDHFRKPAEPMIAAPEQQVDSGALLLDLHREPAQSRPVHGPALDTARPVPCQYPRTDAGPRMPSPVPSISGSSISRIALSDGAYSAQEEEILSHKARIADLESQLRSLKAGDAPRRSRPTSSSAAFSTPPLSAASDGFADMHGAASPSTLPTRQQQQPAHPFFGALAAQQRRSIIQTVDAPLSPPSDWERSPRSADRSVTRNARGNAFERLDVAPEHQSEHRHMRTRRHHLPADEIDDWQRRAHRVGPKSPGSSRGPLAFDAREQLEELLRKNSSLDSRSCSRTPSPVVRPQARRSQGMQGDWSAQAVLTAPGSSASAEQGGHTTRLQAKYPDRAPGTFVDELGITRTKIPHGYAAPAWKIHQTLERLEMLRFGDEFISAKEARRCEQDLETQLYVDVARWNQQQAQSIAAHAASAGTHGDSDVDYGRLHLARYARELEEQERGQQKLERSTPDAPLRREYSGEDMARPQRLRSELRQQQDLTRLAGRKHAESSAQVWTASVSSPTEGHSTALYDSAIDTPGESTRPFRGRTHPPQRQETAPPPYPNFFSHTHEA
ncbi:hypothetical protein CBOM_05207 [Ceraceosorus bombacis]|uniref:Molecular chaperones HSP70/HSC70, HSP70 superfamily n=1 Tax=Ceraceosorus bombacis TaxID=401625 RepID=A0A0N7LAA0_9BASI|nr:hypothetical protein CBOM_05207 [Ceraceosorus bombacis]